MRAPPPPGATSCQPRGAQHPAGHTTGTVPGPRTCTAAPAAHGRRTPTARPKEVRPGEHECLTSGAPHNSASNPPGGAPPPPPQRATPAHQKARGGAGAGSPCPHHPGPGNRGDRYPPGATSCHPRGAQRPEGHARQRHSAGPRRLHTRAHSNRAADPNHRTKAW